eukprot:TCONS_00047659-protein
MGQQASKELNDEIQISSTISKKLVNDPSQCVTESLQGFVMTNPDVKLLEGHNVVVRADLADFRESNKVALITGGGSGHEPAHVGFIGKGMLTSAVCGDIFTSPTSISILDTIRSCANKGGSALLIVKNYTGDRLNFGKAAEIAKGDGIDVEMVVVADDCALTSQDKSAGRRGLCGTILIHKMAGAMSEQGKSLNEMAQFLREAVKEIGTISISLSPCSIPGKPVNFTIDDDAVEFGLGIHGEAGVSKIKIGTANELVSKMLQHVRNSGYLPEVKDKEVALVVNNLGGTSNLELTLVAREAVNLLTSNNVKVSRCYVGTYVTSMEMAGVSLSIMILNENRKEYLDAPCDAPAWKSGGLLNDVDNLTIPCFENDDDGKTADSFDVKPEGTGLIAYYSLKKICQKIIENEEKLNELDRSCGDGDTGTTFARAAKEISKRLEDQEHVRYPINDASQLSSQLANTLETFMGGSSGALLSLFLNAAANGFNHDEVSTTKSLICAFELGLNAIKKYGGAEEGDRTMIDALSPALESFKTSQQQNLDTEETLREAATAARNGTNETAKMKAKAGRASYTAESNMLHPDPGAYAIALVLEAIHEAYSKQ